MLKNSDLGGSVKNIANIQPSNDNTQDSHVASQIRWFIFMMLERHGYRPELELVTFSVSKQLVSANLQLSHMMCLCDDASMNANSTHSNTDTVQITD